MAQGAAYRYSIVQCEDHSAIQAPRGLLYKSRIEIIAQQIRLRLPSSSPGLESQTHNLGFFHLQSNYVLYLVYWVILNNLALFRQHHADLNSSCCVTQGRVVIYNDRAFIRWTTIITLGETGFTEPRQGEEIFNKKIAPIPASFCLVSSFSHYNFNNTN